MNQRQILNNILKYGIYNDKNYTLTKIVFSSYSHSMTIYTTSTNVSSDEVTVVSFVVITRSSSSNSKTEYRQPISFQHHLCQLSSSSASPLSNSSTTGPEVETFTQPTSKPVLPRQQRQQQQSKQNQTHERSQFI